MFVFSKYIIFSKIINLWMKMDRCNFWKNKSKNLLCWQGLVLLDWSWQVRTCPNHDFWSNLTRFGFKIRFLTKFLNDSAWFLLEKLKKHIISTKNFTIWPNILKIKKIHQKGHPTKHNARFLWYLCCCILVLIFCALWG